MIALTITKEDFKTIVKLIKNESRYLETDTPSSILNKIIYGEAEEPAPYPEDEVIEF